MKIKRRISKIYFRAIGLGLRLVYIPIKCLLPSTVWLKWVHYRLGIPKKEGAGLRILMINTHAYGGGAAIATRRLFQALRSQGIDVWLLVQNADSSSERATARERQRESDSERATARERQRESDSERATARERQRESDSERATARERQRESDSERATARERQRESDSERATARERQRESDSERATARERQRESDSERATARETQLTSRAKKKYE